MSQAAKIIKVNGGSAFIEIGEDYVRIGVGDKVFFTLDESSISGGAQQVNWQLDPNKIVYQGLINHQRPLPGLLPVGPRYGFNANAIMALFNLARSMTEISSAVGIGR